MTIRNPVEWGYDLFRDTTHGVSDANTAMHRGALDSSPPQVRRIGYAALGEVLRKGIADFGLYRTDILFIAVIYPLAGLVLAQLALSNDFLPLVFPLAAGFALIGPVAAVGLYEMSRQREKGLEVSWAHAFDVCRSPNFGALLGLSAIMALIFCLWLAVAWGIYAMTLGPATPTSIGAFVTDVFTTGAGWTMIVLGIGAGFCFALLAFALSVVSFPLLLDRNVRVKTAMQVSIDAVRTNPGPMLAWAFVVACGLVLGSLPLLLGLIVVMPVLGHATWHLYRRVIG